MQVAPNCGKKNCIFIYYYLVYIYLYFSFSFSFCAVPVIFVLFLKQATFHIFSLMDNFTKPSKLARERNSKTAPMGVEISVGDWQTTHKLKNTDTTSHLHIDQRNNGKFNGK